MLRSGTGGKLGLTGVSGLRLRLTAGVELLASCEGEEGPDFEARLALSSSASSCNDFLK